MAGLGFKDFTVGEVLTSANVDGYLMQQTVMRFADSAARGSALGTATGTAVPLAEGMVSYLDDTDTVEVYDGSAWLTVNKVIQTVTTVDSGTGTVSVTTPFASGTAAAITEGAEFMSVSITPTSASSILYVEAQVSFEETTNHSTHVAAALFRNGVTNALNFTAFNAPPTNFEYMSGGRLMYSEVAGTTSTVTYSVRVSGDSAGSLTKNTVAQAYNWGVGSIVSLLRVVEVQP